ncbi:MAG: hypothetical protein M1821_002860 [Bathelium mastoideum]|nr:MAG: hypothetical protein M1821_002860 [Bathelium mastoideum]
MTEEEELQAKIAALSGRIQMHKQAAEHVNYSSPSIMRGGDSRWTPQRGTPYGIPRGRGYRYQPPHRNRSLVMNSPGSPQTSPTVQMSPTQSAILSTAQDSTGWVKRHDRHDQLINTAVFDQKNQERIQAMEETAQKKQRERNALQKHKVMKHFAVDQVSASPGQATNTTVKHEVDVDNIRFCVADGGSKLIRIDGEWKPIRNGHDVSVTCVEGSPGNPQTARSTPKKTSIGGVLFLRSKNGNLYRSGLVKKKQAGQLRKTAAAPPATTEEEHIVVSDFSSDEEYDQIDSDDIDSDDLMEDAFTPGIEGDGGHELSQQQDYVPF